MRNMQVLFVPEELKLERVDVRASSFVLSDLRKT
jgi:hypothetical protein